MNLEPHHLILQPTRQPRHPVVQVTEADQGGVEEHGVVDAGFDSRGPVGVDGFEEVFFDAFDVGGDVGIRIGGDILR